jgi:flagellar hook-associated protein 2
MDTESIINQLLTVDRNRLVDRFYQQKQTVQWKQEIYRETNTKMLALRNAAFDLRLQGSFQVKKVETSNSEALTAKAGSNALNGTYSLEVLSMAKGAFKEIDVTSLPADYKHIGADKTFKVIGEKGNAEITVTEGQTMKDIAASINNVSTQTGVQANYDEGVKRLFLMSSNTGSTAKISLADTADNFLAGDLGFSTADLDEVLGTDAKVKFNGGAELTFASNQFTLSGIDFNIKKAGETTNVIVSNDVDGVIDKIKAFVEAYNNVVSFMGDKIAEKRDRDYSPLTQAQKDEMTEDEVKLWEEKSKSGLLNGDSLYRSLYNSMRSSATGYVSGLAKSAGGKTYNSLSSIGITTSDYLDKGKLYIDEDKLRAALNDDPGAVQKLFTNTSDSSSGAVGLASRIYDSVNSAMQQITVKAGSSAALVDVSNFGKEISRLDSQMSAGETRLQKLEDKYWAQYTAMETALAKLQEKSDWLTQQLSLFTSN